MTITRKQLGAAVQSQFSLQGDNGQRIITDLFNEIESSLADGHDVSLYGICKFQLINKRERIGRNPQNGELHMIQARKFCAFKAGRMMKKASQTHASKQSLNIINIPFLSLKTA